LTGLSELKIEDEDQEDEELKRNQPTAEELRLKAQREREEKQRKYDEVRAKIFGSSGNGSGASSPGSVTPPDSNDDGRNTRGRGRGGRGGSRQEGRNPDNQIGTRELYDPNSTAKSGPSSSLSATRELYDPNFTPRPASSGTPKHGQDGSSSGRSTPRAEEQILRTPKGPDGSGRGGSGFTHRGGKAG
jgi:hypothetical protein